jgi:hypothetical protein
MLRLTYQATRGLRRFRWADLLANITSMFVDVLPPSGERYIVGCGPLAYHFARGQHHHRRCSTRLTIFSDRKGNLNGWPQT